MVEPARRTDGAYLARAGCAPLVVFSFLAAGAACLERWGGVLVPDQPAVGAAMWGLCLMAGVPYLLRTAGPASSRAGLVLAYLPVMAFALWWYALAFGMLVLGVYP